MSDMIIVETEIDTTPGGHPHAQIEIVAEHAELIELEEAAEREISAIHNAEQERQAHDRQEDERQAHERQEHDRQEHERQEHDRQEHERQEHDRQEHERQEHDRQEHDRQEHDRQEHERQEHDRQEHDRQEHDRQEHAAHNGPHQEHIVDVELYASTGGAVDSATVHFSDEKGGMHERNVAVSISSSSGGHHDEAWAALHGDGHMTKIAEDSHHTGTFDRVDVHGDGVLIAAPVHIGESRTADPNLQHLTGSSPAHPEGTRPIEHGLHDAVHVSHAEMKDPNLHDAAVHAANDTHHTATIVDTDVDHDHAATHHHDGSYAHHDITSHHDDTGHHAHHDDDMHH